MSEEDIRIENRFESEYSWSTKGQISKRVVLQVVKNHYSKYGEDLAVRYIKQTTNATKTEIQQIISVIKPSQNARRIQK